MVASLRTLTRRRSAFIAGLVAALAPCVSHAALRAIGHEFRPTTDERTREFACPAGDGTTGFVEFRCQESQPGHCADPNIGTLFATWRSADGNAVAEPIEIGMVYGSSGIPYDCAADGRIVVLREGYLRLIDRNGFLEVSTAICGGGPCWGPFALTATNDGFFVMWSDYTRGLVGRSFGGDGVATTAPRLLFKQDRLSVLLAANGLLQSDGSIVVAWREGTSAVSAMLVHPGGTADPPVPASEFPYLDQVAPLVLVREDGDRSIVAWQNVAEQAGWVARRIVSGDAPVTTTSTTTTTLEPDAEVFEKPISLGTTPAGDDTYFLARPGLIGDVHGRWAATWPDYSPADEYDEMETSIASSRDGALQWSLSETFHFDPYDSRLGATIATDGDSVALAAWPRRDGAILLRQSADGGQTWSEDSVLYAGVGFVEGFFGGYVGISDIALTPGGDGVWLATWSEAVVEYVSCWEDPGCIDYKDKVLICALRSARSFDAGSSWTEATTIAAGVCGERDLAVATDKDGQWLAIWRDWHWDGPDSVAGAWSSDNGQTWSEQEVIAADVRLPQRALSVAADEDQWVIAFARADWDEVTASLNSNIYVSRRDSGGGEWSDPAGIAPWNGETPVRDLYPSLEAAGDGLFGLAWSSHSAGAGLDADIVASFSHDGAASWTGPRLVDPEAREDPAKDLNPELVRAGEAWGVAWRARESSSNVIRFARTRGSCGNGEPDEPEQCDDGNDVDADGCDRTCRPTGCGSFVVTGDEQCDDGNTTDTDSCVDCRDAFCGDGFVEAGHEECDDANDVDGDGCLNDCRVARCGDAVVRAGVETCDDGDTSGNNDSCLSDCSLPVCGDGYVEIGPEECDDGNLADGDGCTSRCVLDPDCGFFSRSGLRVTATDALKVLKRATGLATRCPLRNCDRNGDDRVTASDALAALRSAVGLFAEGCSLPTGLVVRMTSDEKLGAVEFSLRFADAAGFIPAKGDGKPRCTIKVGAPTLSAIGWDDRHEVVAVSIVSVVGVQGPATLVECSYDPVSGPSLRDFQLTVQHATSSTGSALDPLPTLVVETR
ncbi:MAG TPA: DUF4215 domain-containing protein [Candidatus Limnocylindrales bacterium]|nr:DUF4215 domain-containing protein [Candidatus Limnocylindrales bacterium]